MLQAGILLSFKLMNFIKSDSPPAYNVGCMVACGNRKHTLSSYDNANRKQGL